MAVNLAIPVSDKLYQACKRYISCVEDNPSRADTRRLISVMHMTIEESMGAVGLDILKHAELGHTIYFIASMAEKGVLAITNSILKRVIKQMDSGHHHLAATYMKGLLREMDHPLEGQSVCLAIPIDHEIAVGILEMIERSKTEPEKLTREEIGAHLGEVLDVWLDVVLAKPLAMMSLDSVASRLAEKGIHTARSTLHGASFKAYRHLSVKQKAKIGEYLGHFFIDDTASFNAAQVGGFDQEPVSSPAS
ncbi:hypothetical protein M3P05_14105 [Sansalvadorimonas sp. 2012CJ34-2]|uniref:Uncharacterized protein n=1 Tax=Parendozoicomonas callyspongiae TaxID=2942213 RepID=A0ABT0PJB0_9GAMM|nr:hypothetical protein [Sansalvadorimonas sp. 2012CJ34-2]MCL6271061.1 hypothetical protein [Sansalvadorimonas sp. 2012CJ34-2]